MEAEKQKLKKFETHARQAVEEMIDAIDNFFNVSPFEISRADCGDHIGDVVFADENFPTDLQKFHGHVERWMPMIIPGHPALRRRVQAVQTFIDGKIDELDHIIRGIGIEDAEANRPVMRRWNAYNTYADAVSVDAHEFGVAFGILIDLKWAGLSRLEIRERAEGLILQARHSKARGLELGVHDD